MDTSSHSSSASGGALSLAVETKTIASARRRAEELLDLIERRKQRITEDFYDVGVALRDLERKKLWAVLGYKSFGHMLVARRVMSKTSATKLVTIVETMSRSRALPLGSERAFAIAHLVAHAQGTTTIDEIIDRGIDVDGRTTKVTDLSRRDIERLSRGLRAPVPPRPKERDAINAARRAQSALRRAGAHGASARAFRRKGSWCLQIELAMEVVEAFLEKIRD